MGLFRKKQQNDALFGASIPPSCAYCVHNIGSEEQVSCPYTPLIEAFRSKADFYCRHYTYDPLLRTPKQPGDGDEKA